MVETTAIPPIRMVRHVWLLRRPKRMLTVIDTPWGEESVVVEQSQDLRWYAVLRDGLGPHIVGGDGVTAEDAVAALRQQCQRFSGPHRP